MVRLDPPPLLRTLLLPLRAALLPPLPGPLFFFSLRQRLSGSDLSTLGNKLTVLYGWPGAVTLVPLFCYAVE